MDYLIILSADTGASHACIEIVTDLPADASRQDVLRLAREAMADRCGPEFKTATVLFFSIEPNRLDAPLRGVA